MASGGSGIVERAQAVAEDVLAHLTVGTPVPGWQWLLAACLVGLAVLIVLPRLSGQVVTIAHEGGHALAAVLTGRRGVAVRVHSDGSGLTYSRGRPRGFGLRLTAFAGYPFPGLLGAGLIAAAVSGSARLWAGAAAGALLILLLRTGNLHGWFAIGSSLAGLVLGLWFLPPATFPLALAGLGAVLVGGALRSLLQEPAIRRRGARTDVAALAGGSRVGGVTWWGLMVMAVAAGVWLAWGYVVEQVPDL